MARGTITTQYVLQDVAGNTGAGTAIDATNGHNIPCSGTNATGYVKSRKVMLRFTNTITNATKNVTIRAGVYPPAATQGIGDLVVAVPQSGDVCLAISGSRFVQADGSINVDYASGMTGAIWVFEVNKSP